MHCFVGFRIPDDIIANLQFISLPLPQKTLGALVSNCIAASPSLKAKTQVYSIKLLYRESEEPFAEYHPLREHYELVGAHEGDSLQILNKEPLNEETLSLADFELRFDAYPELQRLQSMQLRFTWMAAVSYLAQKTWE